MSRPSRLRYIGACVGLDGEDINALTESGKAITLRTFREAIGRECWRELTEQLGYGQWLRINKDWHVGFYRGKFRGTRAYYLTHSAIEHVFADPEKMGPSLGRGRRTISLLASDHLRPAATLGGA